MQTFLLTWNPKKWAWDTLDADYDTARKQGFHNAQWSCGRSKRLHKGDRVFVAAGSGAAPHCRLWLRSSDELYEGDHFSGGGGSSLYVDTRFDILLHPDREPILRRADLDSGALAAVHWDTQSSGITIAPEAAAELEERWRAFLIQRGYTPIVLADEIPSAERFWEGALRRITVNTYERDAWARRACIAHFGAACRVCGFDFGAIYGELGSGFIHVHHTRPLSDTATG